MDSSCRGCVKLTSMWITCESRDQSWGFSAQKAKGENRESGAKLHTNRNYLPFVSKLWITCRVPFPKSFKKLLGVAGGAGRVQPFSTLPTFVRPWSDVRAWRLRGRLQKLTKRSRFNTYIRELYLNFADLTLI